MRLLIPMLLIATITIFATQITVAETNTDQVAPIVAPDMDVGETADFTSTSETNDDTADYDAKTPATDVDIGSTANIFIVTADTSDITGQERTAPAIATARHSLFELITNTAQTRTRYALHDNNANRRIDMNGGAVEIGRAHV
mgnify:CR=1 FL=1